VFFEADTIPPKANRRRGVGVEVEVEVGFGFGLGFSGVQVARDRGCGLGQ